jgi:hypothetical protein
MGGDDWNAHRFSEGNRTWWHEKAARARTNATFDSICLARIEND